MRFIKPLLRISLLFAVTGTTLALSSGSASATDYNVAAGNDTLSWPGDSSCSLSEAINNISDGTNTYSDCPAPTGDDRILLPAGTITLTADVTYSSKPFSVIGAGRGSSIIEGAGFARLFALTLGSQSVAHSMEFKDFTARNISRTSGSACIYAADSSGSTPDQDIAVSNVNLEDCGIYGIYTSLWGSSASISGVNIDSDDTNDTVGIFALRIGSMVIQNSAITGHTLGIHTFQTPISPGNSSAIDTNIDIINSTFTSNRVGLSLNASNSTNTGANITLDLKLYNNTIVGNNNNSSSGYWESLGSSGILWATGGNAAVSVDMKNNLIANNIFNNTLENCYAGTSQYTVNVTVVSTNNLSDDDCAGKFGPNDFANASGATSNLDVLADNGGDVRTMALLIGSPAIDNGTTIGTISTDARGVPRLEFMFDIGAYEKTPANVPDPDPNPEDPDNPGPPDEIQNNTTPKPPRTGLLLGILMMIVSGLTLSILVSKEVIDVRHRTSKSVK